MASLPEQADLETVAADKVRLLVNDEPNATCVLTPEDDTQIGATLSDSQVAVNELNATVAALPISSEQIDQRAVAQEPVADPASSAGKPTEISAASTCIKGGISLSFVFMALSFMAIWPSFVICPFIMPESMWAFTWPGVLLNAGIYSAKMCAVLGSSLALFVPLFVFLECQASKTAFNKTHKYLDVDLNERLAFELCMAAVSKCTLQRADEEAGELCIEVTKRAFVDVRVEKLGPDKSRIHIVRNFDSDLPVLFWKEEVRQLLNNSVSSGSLLAAQIERYIKAHEQFYTQRELLPAEYQTSINYKVPKIRYSAGLALLATLAFYPLFMFCYGHSPSMLDKQARYTKNFDPQGALALYNQALSYQKNSVSLLIERAQLLVQLHQPVAAEADYREALRLVSADNPNNRYILYGLQNALIQQNRLDEVNDIDNLISSNMQGYETPDVLNNRAWDQAIMGNMDNAIANANRAIAMNPKFDAAYGTRGFAYHLMGMEDQALADYTTAIELNPNDRIDRQLRAQVLRNLGMFAQANVDEQAAREMGFYPEELALPPANFNEFGEPTTTQIE